VPEGPAVTCHRLVIPGTGGSVHSNGDLAVTGSADISQDATAAGGFAATGNPTIGGESGGAYGITTFDPIHAIDHLPRADYILQEDGRIVDNMTGSKTKGKTMEWDPQRSASQTTPPWPLRLSCGERRDRSTTT
jgi:hypothetical protein